MDSRHLTEHLALPTMFRQGDVLLLRVPAVPDGAEEIKTPVLVVAQGGQAGHGHRVRLSLGSRAFRWGQRMWIQAVTTETLEHEEHNPIRLIQGIYEVRLQRIHIYGYGTIRTSD